MSIFKSLKEAAIAATKTNEVKKLKEEVNTTTTSISTSIKDKTSIALEKIGTSLIDGSKSVKKIGVEPTKEEKILKLEAELLKLKGE